MPNLANNGEGEQVQGNQTIATGHRGRKENPFEGQRGPKLRTSEWFQYIRQARGTVLRAGARVSVEVA